MQPLTPKVKFILLAVTLGLAAAAVCWTKAKLKAGDRTVLEWLEIWDGANQALSLESTTEERKRVFRQQREVAETAIYELGPAALPELVAVLEGLPDNATRATLEMWSEFAGWSTHPFRRVCPSRGAACRGLAELGPHALPALSILSNAFFQCDFKSFYPQEVAEALVALGTNSIPVFLAGTTNSNQRLRESSFAGLRWMETNASSAEPELRKLLLHPMATIRGRALMTIPAVMPVDENPFPFLLPFLHDSDSEIRVGAMSGLALAARMRDAQAPGVAEAAAAMAALANEDDLDARRRAANLFWHFKAAAAPHVPVLLRLLKDSDEQVRDNAAWSLATLRLPLPAVIEALAKLTASPKLHIRVQAAVGLREMAAAVEKIHPGLVASLGDLGQAQYEERRHWEEYSKRRAVKLIRRPNAKLETNK